MLEEIKAFEEWLTSKSGNVITYKLLPELQIYLATRRLMYHYTLIVGEIGDKCCYLKRYCYQTFDACHKAMLSWNGEGDPEGWHRAPETGRRRPNGDSSKEYIAW